MYDLPEWSLRACDDLTCFGTLNTQSSHQPMNVYPFPVSATHADVDTVTASFHLNRQRQTLHPFVCPDLSSIRPLSASGCLAWPGAGRDRHRGVNTRIAEQLSNQV